MTDILLTGAGGQIGSEIGRRGRHAGLTVCALDHLGLDITDRDAIRAIVDGIQPRIVVNAATYPCPRPVGVGMARVRSQKSIR